jgi:hypothetical protein
MWYDEQPEYVCPDCDDKESRLDEGKEFLKEIIDLLYSNKKFDLEHFEFCLENLCHHLKVKLPDNELVLHRPTPTDRAVDAWKKWNTSFLKSLTYTN